VAELIADERIASFKEVARIIASKSSSVLCLDSTFRLELCFLDQAEELIGKAIQKAILNCLPDPTGPSSASSRSMEQAVMQLAMLRRSEMVKRSSPGAIGQLESVLHLVESMQRGVSPEVTNDLSGFFNLVLDRCAAFFHYSADKGVTKTGKPAIQECVKNLEKKFADGAVVPVPDIEQLRPFWWLLSKAQVVTIQSMLERAIKAATDQGQASGSSLGRASALKVGGAAKRKSASSDDQIAKKATLMKLFR
jgi:hypothetical protein